MLFQIRVAITWSRVEERLGTGLGDMEREYRVNYIFYGVFVTWFDLNVERFM